MKRKKKLSDEKVRVISLKGFPLVTELHLHPSLVTRHSSLILLAIFSFTQVAATFPWDYVNKNNEGIKKYLNKEYSEAELIFRRVHIDNSNIPQIKYNLADNLYKQGKYIESQTIYLDLLKETDLENGLKEKIFYNLGNLFYRLGEQNNPGIFWFNALNHYETAINLNNEDKEARENYDFVKNKLEKLNKQNNTSNNGTSNEKKLANNKNDNQNPTAYSNSPTEKAEKKISGITKSEVEEILQDLKLQEESTQKLINRRQLKNKNSSQVEKNPYFKDW